MLNFTRAVSWSRFKTVLDCPKKLEHELNQIPVVEYGHNYWRVRGTLVQFVFELFYANKVNQRFGGTARVVMERIAHKVLESGKMNEDPVSYPVDKNESTMKEEVLFQVLNGWRQLQELELLDKEVLVEKDWFTIYNGFRMSARFDYLYLYGSMGAELFDGKGTQKPWSDPRQLYYYALMLHSAGLKVTRGGFLFYNHDKVMLDLGHETLKRFVEEDFRRGRSVFDSLVKGVEELPATPSPETCRMCNWRLTCKDSLYNQGKRMETEPAA